VVSDGRSVSLLSFYAPHNLVLGIVMSRANTLS
jgi:hypothetical protein